MTEQIHTGRWTDWSYGGTLGENLTMSTRHATYLISFIATFDVWVGAAAWYLVAFILHQSMTLRKPRDGAAHQVQVTLRNSSTPLAFIRNTLFIGWAWRRHSWKVTSRTWALMFIPIVLAILFVFAGIASARIASVGDVLLAGGDCGLVNPNVQDPLDAVQIQLSEAFQDGMRMGLSNSYAQECYQNPFNTQEAQQNSSNVSDLNCEGYATIALNYTWRMVDCPLNDACVSSGQGALRLDTGYLDSHTDFGLNAPQDERVALRKVTTCSPLTSQGFSDNTFDSIDGYGDVAVYSYGNNSYQPTRFGAEQGIPSDDATFVYSKNTYTSSQTAYYMMVASTMYNGSTGSTYTPSSRLSTNAARPISLIFLANRAFYQGMTNDSWFNATSPIGSVANGDVADTLYQNNNPGAVLGCTEQLQLCNPNTKSSNNCTDLDSWSTWGDFTTYYGGKNMTMLDDIEMTSMQQTTAMMLQDASIAGTVWNVVDQLGPKALIASSYVSQQEIFWSPALPSNQWQIEVANWFSIGLAHTQRLFIANYRTPSTPVLLKYWLPFPDNDTNVRNFCDSQKVYSSEYTTFNVLGLGLNFGLGGLVLICGYLLPFIIPKVQACYAKRVGKVSLASEQWTMNNALQLQRVAYESHDIGSWTRKEKTVPITTELEKFDPPTQYSVSAALRRRRGQLEEAKPESVADSHGTLGVNEAPLLSKHIPRESEEEEMEEML